MNEAAPPTARRKEFRRALLLRLIDLKARLGMRRQVFADIYRYNLWGNEESRSGNGSTLRDTESVRRQLPVIIRDFGIESVLDAPCGDYRWMSQLNLDLKLYIGADIVPQLIESNIRRYGTDNGRRFMVLDIAEDRPPTVDLIVSRHCMIHMSLSDVASCLQNFVRSGSRYLMATTIPTCVCNRDIRTGGFRELNLQIAPFFLPEPLARIHDAAIIDGRPLGDGWLYLWKLSDVAEALRRRVD